MKQEELEDDYELDFQPENSFDNDYVWVRRVRKDESTENAINLWVVSDNVRKGAATNAVQIAEYLRTL